MNASEFHTVVHDGMIAIPENQQFWNGKKIRVILLEDDANNLESTDQPTLTETNFFDLAGIWKNREIDQEALRKQAWRNEQL
ncbi:MAG: hypothetical protein ABSB19_18680 [Methylomonas sp.]|jgi:hypothetical protein